jgi:hypothetical protein
MTARNLQPFPPARGWKKFQQPFQGLHSGIRQEGVSPTFMVTFGSLPQVSGSMQSAASNTNIPAVGFFKCFHKGFHDIPGACSQSAIADMNGYPGRLGVCLKASSAAVFSLICLRSSTVSFAIFSSESFFPYMR